MTNVTHKYGQNRTVIENSFTLVEIFRVGVQYTPRRFLASGVVLLSRLAL